MAATPLAGFWQPFTELDDRSAESIAPTLAGSIVFDAIPVKNAERQPILEAAKAHSSPTKTRNEEMK
jgi:hypothetical protein